MNGQRPNEAKAHHFVPQCWLAGFTDTGERDGMLYVTDLRRKKQWRCKPSEAGHRRNFNRVDDPSVSDPLAIEKAFAQVENDVAPVFSKLMKERRGPKDGLELGTLVEYLAIQLVRVPAFRTLVRETLESEFRKNVLSSREVWEQALRRAGVSSDDPGADYEKVLEGIASGQLKFSAETAFYLKHGADLLPAIEPSLMGRCWDWHVSPTGEFIGSDNPVALDGEQGKPIGVCNADVVIYPVSRRLLLYGTHKRVALERLTSRLMARHNTFAMLTADEQVYSHRSDFHWLDCTGKCQNDWRLFSRELFLPTERG